MIAVEPYMM